MAHIKKQVGFLANCALVLFSVAACNENANQKAQIPNAPQEVRVSTWADYFKPEVIKEFEQENNVKVVLDFFASNEELLAKVQATVQAGGRGYDVILPSDYMVGAMARMGLLQDLDKTKLAFLDDFGKEFLTPSYDPTLKNCVPFAWGTTGIAVNTKLARTFDSKKGLSWKDLFENPAYKSKATMIDDAKENLHSALMVIGRKWSTATEDDVRKAFDYLKAHKKQLRIFTTETRPVIEKDECTVCQVYSGDAMQTAKKKAEITYVIPTEGATIWTDNLAIPKNAGSSEMAYKFMAKMLSVDGAKRFTETTLFASPNLKAMGLLDTKLKSNAALFPDAATMNRLSYLTERPELLTLVDRLWTELKSL